MDKSTKTIVIAIWLTSSITIVTCYAMAWFINWEGSIVFQDANATVAPPVQDVKVVEVVKEVHHKPTINNVEGNHTSSTDVKVVEVVKEVHHKPTITNNSAPAPDVQVVEVVKEVHHKPVINNTTTPAPDVKVVEVVKEIHHKPSVKVTKIDIPVSVQGQLDRNLDYILNNTCKFVSQSPAFIDANQELAIECAQLWAMVTNALSK